jgi:hypothetical protein
MERLTERSSDYRKKPICMSNAKCAIQCGECEHMDRMMEKLADFEDKQEQGLLIELKAKAGDYVFKIVNGVISRLEITRIEITIYGVEYFTWAYTLTNEGCGVTWFLTEDEAEEALTKMKGE